ncbi:MAG: hypothetical protein IPO63_12925 [Bacteroidetes bacterium]|nr:hypothetical protein [Bacteroidota bacterium]
MKTLKVDKLNDFSGFFILLDKIQDPGNLGTIIRIADWFGVDGILCSTESVDFYNPKVIQASMGSVGVDSLLNKFITNKLHIPAGKSIGPKAESLNVAIATAIICSEWARNK